jgi:hypothetical protein
MPIESMIVSALVVAVFAIFAIAMAYGQYQTRHLSRAPDAPAPAEPVEERWLEAA